MSEAMLPLRAALAQALHEAVTVDGAAVPFFHLARGNNQEPFITIAEFVADLQTADKAGGEESIDLLLDVRTAKDKRKDCEEILALLIIWFRSTGVTVTDWSVTRQEPIESAVEYEKSLNQWRGYLRVIIDLEKE